MASSPCGKKESPAEPSENLVSGLDCLSMMYHKSITLSSGLSKQEEFGSEHTSRRERAGWVGEPAPSPIPHGHREGGREMGSLALGQAVSSQLLATVQVQQVRVGNQSGGHHHMLVRGGGTGKGWTTEASSVSDASQVDVCSALKHLQHLAVELTQPTP